MTLEEQKASQKTSHFILGEKNPTKQTSINQSETHRHEKGGKPLADVILKELVSMLAKARCGAQQMEGGRWADKWSRFDKILACSMT